MGVREMFSKPITRYQKSLADFHRHIAWVVSVSTNFLACSPAKPIDKKSNLLSPGLPYPAHWFKSESYPVSPQLVFHFNRGFCY